MSRERAPLLVLLSVLSLAGAGGCRDAAEPPRRPVLDLVEAFDLAEAEREPGTVELGTPAARAMLGAGWSGDEGTAGETYVWSDGPESELRFVLTAARDVPLTLRGTAYAEPGAPPQRVTVLANGREVGRVPVFPEGGQGRIVLPAAALRMGENRLLLRYAWMRSPRPADAEADRDGTDRAEAASAGADRAGTDRAGAGSSGAGSSGAGSTGAAGDDRSLAVAWEMLRFETGVDERSAPRAVGDRLAIPAGWRLAYYLPLSGDAALYAEDLRTRGGGRGALAVDWTPEGGEERRAGRAPAAGGAVTLELGNPEPGLARVTIAALPTADRSGGDAAGELILRRPVLLAASRGDGGVGFATAAGPAGAGVQNSGVHGGRGAEVGGPRPAARARRPRTEDPAAAAGSSVPLDLAPAASPDSAAAHRPPNLIVYLVDTLRADHLGCYGYPRPVSPRLDAFARRATLFRHAVAASPWTRPSVASLFTGLSPPAHDVHDHRDALAPQAVTLAELLQAAGYRTAGLITNPNVAGRFGLGQGFDDYRLLPGHRNSAAAVTAHAVAWLRERTRRPAAGGPPPFFLYLHTVEPHAPYQPPPAFRRRFAPRAPDRLTLLATLESLDRGAMRPTPEVRRGLVDLYDAEIAANDAAFGGLLDALAELGLDGETVVVFVSDHGEEFHEHGGWGHGTTLHRELLDVPLVIRVPGSGEGRVVERLARHVDLMPTLLELAGAAVPPAVEGRSLLPWIAGGGGEGRGGGQRGGDDPSGAAGEPIAFSWLAAHGVRAAAVTTPDWKLIETREPHPRRALYDRRTDPGERRDVAAGRPVRGGYLASRLRAAERPGAGALEAERGEIDPETRRQLRALGYLR